MSLQDYHLHQEKEMNITKKMVIIKLMKKEHILNAKHQGDGLKVQKQMLKLLLMVKHSMILNRISISSKLMILCQQQVLIQEKEILNL